jgi:hypothetical protein
MATLTARPVKSVNDIWPGETNAYHLRMQAATCGFAQNWNIRAVGWGRCNFPLTDLTILTLCHITSNNTIGIQKNRSVISILHA